MIGNVGSLAIVVWLAVVGAATFDSVAAIAAGASGAADRATVTLRLKVPPRSVRGPSPAAERAILDAFLERHPWIRVEPYVELEMEGPRQEATFYMAMAGQTAPDVLRIYGRSAQKYIEQNFLYPLNGYLDEQDLADPMFQKVLPTISRGGEVYGVPATVAVHALLYRKDLFERAGLDPEKPPRTWDELLEVAQRLTVPERGQYGMLLTGGSLAGWQFADFVWQAGGQIVRQQPDGTWRLALDE
ncbi:MAG TPA: extracellular solute-binding protein, partial [Phycisphaeraceae bacterium]